MDEAAYVSQELVYEVIVPLLGIKNTVLFMISTPSDSYNIFSRIMRMKDSKGRPLFLLIDLELSCKRCKDKGAPERCTHRLKHLPPWKSVGKQELMNALMQDKKETMARENYGIVTDDGQSYIHKTAIDRWFAQPRERITAINDAKVVVVCVDPNDGAGKNASEMAIASIALCWGRMVVRFFVLCLALAGWRFQCQRSPVALVCHGVRMHTDDDEVACANASHKRVRAHGAVATGEEVLCHAREHVGQEKAEAVAAVVRYLGRGDEELVQTGHHGDAEEVEGVPDILWRLPHDPLHPLDHARPLGKLGLRDKDLALQTQQPRLAQMRIPV